MQQRPHYDRQGGYQRKIPHTAADFAALDHAQAKRDRKRTARLVQLARMGESPWRRAVPKGTVLKAGALKVAAADLP